MKIATALANTNPDALPPRQSASIDGRFRFILDAIMTKKLQIPPKIIAPRPKGLILGLIRYLRLFPRIHNRIRPLPTGGAAREYEQPGPAATIPSNRHRLGHHPCGWIYPGGERSKDAPGPTVVICSTVAAAVASGPAAIPAAICVTNRERPTTASVKGTYSKSRALLHRTK